MLNITNIIGIWDIIFDNRIILNKISFEVRILFLLLKRQVQLFKIYLLTQSEQLHWDTRLTEWSLGSIQARQVVSFSAALTVTQNQLSSIATAETLILRLLLPFTSSTPPPRFLLL